MERKDSNTVNALLGLLSICPMSGYDIRQVIPFSIGHFWSESYGQIYPALKRMTAEGLIAKKTKRDKGKPVRHEYSLTEAGRERLRAWLESPAQRSPIRNELLLKLFFGGQVGTEAKRRHIEAALAAEEKTLQVYEATEQQLRREQANDPQLPYWLMTLNLGRHCSRATIAWCRETLMELDRLAELNRQ
jgi:DNA-binding PadR family transcriptional regulator